MLSLIGKRFYSVAATIPGKVAVLGAGGGIGQPLSLLLKEVKHISHLSLYDIVNTAGIAADLSHISTASKVTGHTAETQLADSLQGAEVVVIPAGVPRKPGMTRDDLFKVNATIVANLATACAKNCPKALLLVIANPVNSTVPIVAEVFKKHGVYDPKRLFGVTTLDETRAKKFISEVKSLADPGKIDVNVVGGHSGATIVPILSQLKGVTFSQAEVDKLTHRIQFGGDEVVKAKAGAGSATLSMAYAAREFVVAVLEALRGNPNVIASAYVQSTVVPKATFFATKVHLGKNGVEKIHPIGPANAHEQKLLDVCVGDLQKEIKKGEDFAKTF